MTHANIRPLIYFVDPSHDFPPRSWAGAWGKVSLIMSISSFTAIGFNMKSHFKYFLVVSLVSFSLADNVRAQFVDGEFFFD